jgi:hypothetical protein
MQLLRDERKKVPRSMPPERGTNFLGPFFSPDPRWGSTLRAAEDAERQRAGATPHRPLYPKRTLTCWW